MVSPIQVAALYGRGTPGSPYWLGVNRDSTRDYLALRTFTFRKLKLRSAWANPLIGRI
jgi:hypothetical protein